MKPGLDGDPIAPAFRVTDHAHAVVLDAVSSGAVLREQLFLGPVQFERAFDRPWHGLGDADLETLLYELVATGALAVERRRGASLFGLTQRGGELWERAMRIDWHRYNEALFNRSRCLDAVRATTEEACERVIAALHAGGLQDVRMRPVIRFRNVRWTWSNWKHHRGYYRIELDHPPLNDVEEQRVIDALRRARAGWKRGFEMPVTH